MSRLALGIARAEGKGHRRAALARGQGTATGAPRGGRGGAAGARRGGRAACGDGDGPGGEREESGH